MEVAERNPHRREDEILLSFYLRKEEMIKRISNMKKLPYRTYVAVLLKDESKLELAEKLELEGYSLITKSPKMIMLFLEYIDGKSSEIYKKVWSMI